jgi:UDP-N-acetylglucosamine 2-epimerase (hydrolysing)
MRFTYFLQLLKNADFIVGNSSAGVREAPHYGVPAINVGSRQNRRVKSEMVVNVEFSLDELLNAMRTIESKPRLTEENFGDGQSASRFKGVMESHVSWSTSIQKEFYDESEALN